MEEQRTNPEPPQNPNLVDLSRLDSFLDERVNSIQQANKPSAEERFGQTNPSTKVYSDAEIGEMKDKGVDMFRAWQDGFNYEQTMSDLQGGGEAATRAIFGGLYKGALTAIEDIGYLADVQEWTGMADEFDKGYTNWASELAKQAKENYDESNPIHSGGTFDYGWWMQNMQGIIDSAVGFGATGGVAGKAAKYGSKILGAMLKSGAVTEAGIARWGTALATNYAESKMMSSELYKNVYNKALSEGYTHEMASEAAAKNADEFIIQNKLNTLTDFVALRHLTNGRALTTGAAEKAFKNKALGIGKDALAESYEEVYSGLMQSENERDAYQEIGLEGEDGSSFFERAYDYTTSEQGWREALLGAAGGPIQTAAVQGTAKLINKASEKFGIKEKDAPQHPGEFKEEAPPKPNVELPPNPGPKPVYDKKGKHDVQSEKNKFQVQLKEWELKDKQYQEAKKELDTWDVRMKAYEAKKAEHDKKTSDWQIQMKEYSAEKAIGKKFQAVKDVKEFLQRENDLQTQYRKAVLDGDPAKIKDIENERFENLFLRYAKRQSVEALEEQLKEISQNPEATKEEKEKAAKYLSKIPGMQEDYFKIYNKFGNKGLTDPVFQSKMRVDNSKEILTDINQSLETSKAKLAATVKEVEGKTIPLFEQELLTLRTEQRELKRLEDKLGHTFNPKMASDFNRKLKDYEDRIAQIIDEEALKDNEAKHPWVRDEVKSKVLKELNEFKEFEKLAKDRANAWASYKAYENMHNYMTSSNLESTLRKHNFEYLNEEIKNAVSEEDIKVINKQVRFFDLSKNQREKVQKILDEKAANIFQDEKTAKEEYEKKKAQVNHLVDLQQKTRQEMRSILSQLGRLGKKLKKATDIEDAKKEYLDKIDEDVPVDSEFIRVSNKNKLKKVAKQGDEQVFRDIEALHLERNKLRNKWNFLRHEQNNYEELLNSPMYDLSSYEKLPSVDKVTETKEITDEQNTEEDYGPEPGEERDLTEAEIAAAEKALAKKARKSGTQEDRDKADAASELATLKKIADADVEEKTIGVEDDPKAIPITEEATKKQIDIENSYQWTVAYYSGDDGTNINSPIADWIETNTEVNKVGTTLRFEVAAEDLDNPNVTAEAKLALKRLISGKRLTEGELKIVPIRMVAYKDGQPITVGNKPVQGWLRQAVFHFEGNRYKKQSEVQKARKKIVEAYLKGGTYETKISKVGHGTMEYVQGAKTDPRKYMDSIQLLMSDKEKGYVVSRFDKDRQVHPEYENNPAYPGFIFLHTRKPNGKAFPLKLNSRKLAEEEVEVLYLLTYALTKDFTPDQKVEGIAGISGVTFRQAIDLLVYEGKQSKDKKYPFWINLSEKKVYYGNNSVSFDSIHTQEQTLKDYFSKMWRTTDSSLINKKLSKVFSDDFTWFGREIDIDTDYNDFQFDEGALSSNAVFKNGRLFTHPYILFNGADQWEPVGDFTTEEAAPKESAVAEVQTKAKAEETKAVTSAPVKPSTGVDPLFGKIDPNFNYGPDQDFIAEKEEFFDAEVDHQEKIKDTKTPAPKDVQQDLSKEDILAKLRGFTKEDTKPDTSLDADPDDIFTSSYDGRTKEIDIKAEMEDLRKMLPHVPAHIYNGLLRINGGFAEGAFYKNMIVLSDAGNKGVAYHEAFHAVSQLYLSKEGREELYEETRKRFGKGLSNRQAEEMLAEEFREYMLTRGTLKVPNMFKWLYDLLLDLVNLFRGKKSSLFANIRAGRYDYVPTFQSTEELLSRLPFSMDFIRSGVDILTYLVVMHSGVMSTDVTALESGDMDSLFEKVKEKFAKNAEKKALEGDLEVAKNYLDVLDNWKTFKGLVEDELYAYGLTKASEEKFDQDAYDEYAEDEDFDPEKYKNEGLNIRSALEFSGKDNATGNTKALVALLPLTDGQVDPHFKARRFANFAKTWRLLENNLAGLVDTSGSTGSEKMMDMIDGLAADHPELKTLSAKLRDPNFPEFKKTQFFNAFSKQAVLYSNSIGKKTGKGKYEWIVGNADTQNQANQIKEDWAEAFKGKFVVEGGNMSNKNIINAQIERFKASKDLVVAMSAGTTPFDDKVYIGISNIFGKLGLDVDIRTLRSFTLIHRGSTEAAKLKAAMTRLQYLFTSSDVNISLESMTGANYKWDDDLNFISDNSVVRDLAKIKASFSKIPGENSVLGPDGNSYWTKSLNNFMTKNLSRWKAEPSLLAHQLTKNFHSKSEWIKFLLESPERGYPNLSNFNIEVFLTNRIENAGDSGDSFTDLTQPDEAVDRIVRTLFGVTNANGNGSVFSPLTFADKASFYQISGMKVNTYDTKISAVAGSNQVQLSKKAVKLMYRYFEAEAERIAHAVDNPSNVSVYDEGAGRKFYLFPEFNPGTELAKSLGLFDKDGRPVLTEEVKNKILPYIHRSIVRQIDATKNRLIDLNIIDTDTFEMNGISESLKAHYERKNAVKGEGSRATKIKAIYDLVGDYVINSMQSNIEFMMMFSGDPAFYKDLPKRTSATIATGQDPRIIPDTKEMKGTPRNFKVGIVKDLEGEAPLYKHYLEVFKGLGYKNAESILKPYMKNNQADAQAYIRPERYRNLMRMLGKWEPRHEDAYKRLMNGEKVNPKDLAVMQPLKGMHFELREDGKKLIPTYLKYSQAVLWPALVKGTKLEKVLERMNRLDDEIDELVFESGIKVGSQDIGDFNAIIEGKKDGIKTIILDNFNWKLQQDLPSKYHKKGEARVGSQVKKNIIANLKGKSVTYKGQPLTGEQVIQMVHDIESELSDRGRRRIEKEWGIQDGKITNMKKVYHNLLKKLKADRVNSNILEQIESEVPFDAIFQYKEKIEQELHAMVTKATVHLPSPGGSFIQMSNAGFTKMKGIKSLTNSDIDPNGIIWFQDDQELKGPQLINGEVKPGQVLLPYSIIKAIPDLHKKTGAEIKEIMKEVIDGIVGYRIPNQGTSSIDTLEVAGILPPSAGDTMVTYTEITGKTGSDFDIDKMYVMMPHVFYDKVTGKVKRIDSTGKSTAAVENRRLEVWDAILRSPDVFPELVRPLDSVWLKDDAYYLALLDKVRKSSWEAVGVDEKEFKALSKAEKKKFAVNYFKNEKLNNLEFVSPVYQFDLKVKNTAGKNGVGQTANHLVDHVISQAAKLSFKSNILGNLANLIEINNGEVTWKATDLSGDVNKKGDLITQVISAWLNAYVDNAKDPYISLINNNTYTANTVFMMLRAGVDPEWVNRFMSQPAIRDLANEYFITKSKVLDRKKASFTRISLDSFGALTKEKVEDQKMNNIDVVLRKYSGNKTDTIDLTVPDLKNITLEQLEEQLVNPDPEFQIKLVKAFMQQQFFAKKLNDAVRASKADTQGASGNAAENLAARELVRKVRDEGFLNNFDSKFDNTMLGAKHINSVEFSDKIFSGIFISKSKAVERTVRAVNAMMGNDYVTDATVSKKVISGLYSYLYSDAYMLRANPEELKNMFFGANTIARKTEWLKREYPDNILLQSLSVRTSIDPTKPSFVSINGSKKKDRTEADKLWITWEEMLNDNKELSKGYKMSDYAKDLVKYAYYSSGFSKNLNSFYDLIPNTYMKGNGEGDSFIKYMELLPKKLNSMKAMPEFVDQFFRHNWEDDKLVPSIDKDKTMVIVEEGVRLGKINGFKVKVKNYPQNLNISKQSGYVEPRSYIKMQLEIDNKTNDYLYKYIGYHDGEFYYEGIEPLGMKEKGNYIYEYQFKKEPVSVVNPKLIGLPSSVRRRLQDTDYDYLRESSAIEGFSQYSKEEDGEDLKITFADIDISDFRVIPSKTEDGTSEFDMRAIRKRDGAEFSVATGATKEEALDNGIANLRNMGVFSFYRAFKTECK